MVSKFNNAVVPTYVNPMHKMSDPKDDSNYHLIVGLTFIILIFFAKNTHVSFPTQ